MRRAWFLRFSVSCAVLGVLLAMLGAGLVVSRQNAEQDAQDRGLAATSSEKAALIATELERIRALALLTARIPPFAELYADEGSQAAAIAAVAGPGREINEALAYLWTLYPGRIVAAGYVDTSGAENARIVRGVPVPAGELRTDVRSWPAFAQGLATPAGQARLSKPFTSTRAGVPVVAATTPVVVDGKLRAFVELELATSELGADLAMSAAERPGLAIVDDRGTEVSRSGPTFAAVGGKLSPGLVTQGGWRYAVSELPRTSVEGRHWYAVAAAHPRSVLALAFAPTQAGVLALAVLMLALAIFGVRRSHAAAAEELAAEQRARVEAELRSRTDALTGLFNRRHAVEQVTHELARSSRAGESIGLLMLDIDHFKRINDRQGHAGGDAVIVEVGRRLQAGAREWDTVARIGGEEFFVIAPGVTTEAQVAELGDRFRHAIAERPITVPRGVEAAVTVSVGVVLVHRVDGSAEYAIDRADRALYAAKRRGRDRLCRFSQLDQADLRAEQPECLYVAEAVALTTDLRRGAPPARSRLVADLSAAIARRLELSEDEILRATLGGWLRDVGKIAVPDAILTKPGPLTPAEWAVVCAHSAAGEELLHKFPDLTLACLAVRHHHEHYDGTGYPDGLAGQLIPVEARIVGAAEAFTALVSDRPHSPKRSPAEAVAEIERCAGTHFDPQVVRALMAEVIDNAASLQY
jgi:diguanylate cyclase (GGDEF)-like protein